MTTEADLAALKARLRDWIRAHERSERRFVARSGLSASTVSRLLSIPSYRGTPETWRTIARVCGWDPDEVLALAGFRPATVRDEWGWTLVTRGLTQLGVDPTEQEAIRLLLHLEQAAEGPTYLAGSNSAQR